MRTCGPIDPSTGPKTDAKTDAKTGQKTDPKADPMAPSAPSADASDFLARRREIDAAAAAIGLAPCRLYFNGAVADSGGGGQITLGGATAVSANIKTDLTDTPVPSTARRAAGPWTQAATSILTGTSGSRG